jgi:hypothetical protein
MFKQALASAVRLGAGGKTSMGRRDRPTLTAGPDSQDYFVNPWSLFAVAANEFV